MKVVLQDGMMDCGICSLLSIVRHYGGNVSKEYLREITSTTKNGVTAYHLIEASKKIGFDSFALSGTIEDLNIEYLPCIAHVVIKKNFHHFIVIYEVDFKKQKMLVMDPAIGSRILSINEFKLMTSNTYLIFLPHKKLPLFINNHIIKNTLKQLCSKNKKYLILIGYLSISYFVLQVISAFHFKYLLDFAINYHISKNVLEISILVLFIFLLKEISSFLRNILFLKFSCYLDEIVTTKTYKQIILLPYLYYKNRTTGEIISRIKDLSCIKGFFAKIFTSCFSDFIAVVIFIVLLSKISLKLTIISIFYFFIDIMVHLVFKARIQIHLRKYYKKEEVVNSYLIESISSVDVIKGMHQEKANQDNFLRKYKNLLDSSYQLALVNEIFHLISNNWYLIYQVLLFGFGAVEVIHGDLLLSSFIIYQSILSFLNQSIKNLIDLIHEYPNYKLAIERIEDLFTIRSENFKGGYYFLEESLKGNIVFNNLSFSYKSSDLLKNINLKITPKDKVFLYGASGSGKSTLMKLIMRYFEIPYGNISIDGRDINHYHLDVLRKNITYISQQEFLYSDTLYNNIVLNKDIEKEELEKVSKITLVDEIIKSKNISYDQMVEENGFNFSGGERQRIILARSLLKNSNIYIFDEALSQIDIDRERKILKNIFKYLKGKVVIVISHRFDNKDLFNKVIKMQDGKVYEEKL